MVPRHCFSHIQGQQFLGLGGYILEGKTAMKYEVHLAPGSCQQMEVGQPVYRGKKWEEPKRQFWKVMETLSLTILHLAAREQAPRFTLRQCHSDFGHPRTLWPTS